MIDVLWGYSAGNRFCATCRYDKAYQPRSLATPRNDGDVQRCEETALSNPGQSSRALLKCSQPPPLASRWLLLAAKGSARQHHRSCHQVMHPLFASSHHDGGQVDDDQDVGGDQPRRKATLSIREDGGGQEERKVGHPPGNQLYDRPQ